MCLCLSEGLSGPPILVAREVKVKPPWLLSKEIHTPTFRRLGTKTRARSSVVVVTMVIVVIVVLVVVLVVVVGQS